MKLTRLKILVISGVAALAVAGTGTALAAVSGPVSSSGVVSGCYSSRAVHGSHTLILQDQGTGCPAGTKALSWNQAGTQGPAGTQGAAGVSGLQIETCNTGQLFGFQAPGAGTLNPLCSKVDASGGGITRAYAELDCPQGKVAISAAWGGWDGAYGSTGQGLSPLSTGISGAIRDVTLTDNGRGYVFTADGSWPPLLYVTCATAS